jgi:hypothetical protein
MAMPQMSLYFDEMLASRVTKEAKKKQVSVSRYVGDILRGSMGDKWPNEFLATLGSVKDKSFVRPKQPHTSSDSKREGL